MILQDVRDCLYDTRAALHHCLTHPKTNILATLEASATCYVDSKELLEPLLLMHRSLVKRGDKFVANDRFIELNGVQNLFKKLSICRTWISA